MRFSYFYRAKVRISQSKQLRAKTSSAKTRMDCARVPVAALDVSTWTGLHIAQKPAAHIRAFLGLTETATPLAGTGVATQVSIGYCRFRQASIPPSSGRTR